MANVVYASKAKKFRKTYPIPLKLRHGLKFLEALTDHEYRNLLMEYADELIYRTHRGTQKLKGRTLLKTGELIDKKYLQPIYPKYKEIRALYYVCPNSDIRFWSYNFSDHTFKWLPVAANMLSVYVPKKHFEYKTKWNVAKKGPIEAELIRVDGPYSLAPWLVRSHRKEFRKCALCGRVFGLRSFRQEGKFPQTKEQFCTWHDDAQNNYYSRRFNVYVCNGPCADLLSVFSRSTIKVSKVNHPFLPIPIFLGVIDYANYNPYIRRLAEDFVRYARQVFSWGDDSAGCQSRSEIVRQCIEVSRD